MTDGGSLIVTTGSRSAAIALATVVEIMRDLPVETLGDQPPFVLGLSIIRGAPTPVVHLGRLLGEDRTQTRRFVRLRLGERSAAIAVASVRGVKLLDATDLTRLPPLLGPDNAELVDAVGRLDSELLFVLRTGRIVPESVWTALAQGSR
jgi:purine-binding chemotaxis protein CheW